MSDFVFKSYNRNDYQYNKNKFMASYIRADLIKELKNFSYGRVFTERRAGNACRTKFWLVNSIDQKRAMLWLKKNWGHIPQVTFKIVPFIPMYQKPGIVIKVNY